MARNPGGRGEVTSMPPARFNMLPAATRAALVDALARLLIADLERYPSMGDDELARSPAAAPDEPQR